ncbi:MAG: DoxX family protein [Planctomycetota bacterium]|nr:DoxX family protein [Planctomycetota bacterium]
MPDLNLDVVLQLVLGLGLLNVWLLRAGNATGYRGGDSTSLRQEFAAYGLPTPVFYAVGALKIGCAVGLIAGIWFPELLMPAASVLVLLMLGALAMHIKVNDPLIKSLPAALMLAMSGTLLSISL